MPTISNTTRSREWLLPRPAQSGAFAVLVLVVGTPAIAAFEFGEHGVPRSPQAASTEVTTLPSGDSDAFRGHMLGWRIEPPPQSTIIERDTLPSTIEQPAISSAFGWRADPINGSGRRHAGVDLPGRTGTNVYATGSGRVVSAIWASGYGNLVEIDHPGGLRTRYGHLSKILTRNGATVERGQLIGKVGSTGRTTGPHLHYEIRFAGAAVDPLPFMVPATSHGYDTLWVPERTAEARWGGWAGAAAGNLPQSIIK